MVLSKVKWLYVVSAVFIAVNTYLITKNIYWASLLPVLLLLGVIYLTALDKIVFLITFLTPLAVNISNPEFNLGISIPTEPLMFGVLVFFIIKLLIDSQYDGKILRHPVTIAIFFNLLWLLLTSITSQIPLVSFKFLLARLWFLVPFYFIIVLLFKDHRRIRLFLWLYIIPLLLVIGYTIYNHSTYGFEEQPGHWVMTPFYNDHTAYGAILALFIPVIIGLLFSRMYGPRMKLFISLVLAVFLVAIFLSYSRAAWLSMAFAAGIFLLVRFRIRLRYILLVIAVFIGAYYSFRHQILDRLEQNKQESSANYIEHVQSITNISTDASNLERINRWQSALRMFREKPFWGWGPGTYQFLYAPFQRSKEKTIISTNAGDMGNAHSEYFGPLAESGLLGMLTFMLIATFIIITAIKVFKRSRDPEIKILSLSLLTGLVSYLTHGTMNNFLDTDKASVAFWGFAAAIVALDIYHLRHEKPAESTAGPTKDQPATAP